MDPACRHAELRKENGRFVCATCGGDPSIPSGPSWVLTPAAWRRLGVGVAVAGVLAWWDGIPWFVIHALTTLVHELSHAAAGWIVGCPSVPAFDFGAGGGVTIHQAQSVWVLGLWALVWAALLPRLWGGPWWRPALAALGIQALLAATGLQEPWVVYAGHLGELVFAGIFLVRAATGIAVVQVGESWLYAILGWALWLQSTSLAWRLPRDPEFRTWYLEGKRGLDNDLVRLGDWASCSLTTVCHVHLLVGLAALVVAGLVAGRWTARQGTLDG